ncbi:MAG: UDP-glucose--hexose-1-phosphate uridylyltransferase [Clostridia bacterium]|nr:UDP-glucose--hexose-1-phosphate uridylyltransferase [Clostridia bacterium]
MISYRINQLVKYALAHGLIGEEDKVWAVNELIYLMKENEYVEKETADNAPLEEILGALCDEAAKKSIIGETVAERDVFDAKLMGALTPRPSEVISKFSSLYKESPKKATDWYYDFSRATDYIRTHRIKNDVNWIYPCEYGDVDITINLSKPEKDPKLIALQKSMPQSGYPKCQLCREAEGYAGTMSYPARSNHRIIPIKLCGEDWFLQYSPYVYYNEHCIALTAEHKPMNVNIDTVRRALDFVTQFPHYFIGSNAGLPIVGGSILAHEHMQGGRYDFAMAKAPARRTVKFGGYGGVTTELIKWPMPVVRLRSTDKEEIISLASHIFDSWAEYSDEKAFVFAYTNGAAHNAITPIARRRGDAYEVDLVLRNNITTDEYPLGYFHPHPDKHNIKKENIGLIEVMGLAVLPSRLKKEMSAVADALVEGRDLADDELTSKHKAWIERFAGNYDITRDNVDEVLKKEIGRTFVEVLADAGVFKDTPEGNAAFDRYVESIGGKFR